VITAKELQAELKGLGFYDGDIDGDLGKKSWAGIERAFERLALANRLDKGWQGWGAPRRKVAVEQGIYADAGIEVGTIDGLIGPQTRFARLDWRSRKSAGVPFVIPGRDEDAEKVEDDSRRVPRAAWPMQGTVASFFGEIGKHHAMLTVPYTMRLAWQTSQKVTRFAVHEKVHDAFERIFRETLSEYGPERIKNLGLDLFGGCYNPRKMRGGTKWSMHAWAIAIDLDPARNQLKWGRDRAAFAQPVYEPFWRIVEAEGMVSLGRSRNFDWMHFQAARL
jgi:hypothetical protein